MTCIYENQTRTLDCPMCFEGAIFYGLEGTHYGNATKCPQCDTTGNLITPHSDVRGASPYLKLCEWCFDILSDGICKNDNTKIIDTILSEQKFPQKESQQMYDALKAITDGEAHGIPGGYIIARDEFGFYYECAFCSTSWNSDSIIYERHTEDCEIYKAQQLLQEIES